MKRQELPTTDERKFKGILDALEEKVDSVFFVEIGACDGVSGDPIYHKAIRYNWSGLLIEPISASFQKLQQNYTTNPNVVFENVAISQNTGIRTMFFESTR